MIIELQRMESLEEKYHVELFVEQTMGQSDKYYKIVRHMFAKKPTKVFLGNTLDEVEDKLKMGW